MSGSDCIVWTGATDGRYGHRQVNGVLWKVHRLAYTQHHGPIPEGLVIDHLCKNTLCYNVSHLEAVTQKQNLLRGDTFQARNAAKTHCPHGHPYAGSNLIIKKSGSRTCRECKNSSRRKVAA